MWWDTDQIVHESREYDENVENIFCIIHYADVSFFFNLILPLKLKWYSFEPNYCSVSVCVQVFMVVSFIPHILIYPSLHGHRWVMLKNVHLAPAWLVQLEKKLHSLHPHPQFRLFLTMEITPRLPVNLLRAGRVFVFEPPPGVRANLLRTFSTVRLTWEMLRMLCL